jgi:hypothetical protein
VFHPPQTCFTPINERARVGSSHHDILPPILSGMPYISERNNRSRNSETAIFETKRRERERSERLILHHPSSSTIMARMIKPATPPLSYPSALGSNHSNSTSRRLLVQLLILFTFLFVSWTLGTTHSPAPVLLTSSSSSSSSSCPPASSGGGAEGTRAGAALVVDSDDAPRRPHLLLLRPSFSEESLRLSNETTVAIDRFFRDFGDPITGWIDVNQLSSSTSSVSTASSTSQHPPPLEDDDKIVTLRSLAQKIMGRTLSCGHPKVVLVSTATSVMIPAEDNSSLEHCFWASDIVSAEALNDFSFEKSLWEWVVRMFQNNNHSNSTTTTDAAASSSSCPPLGFLDIGVNVGDWISPIRLLLPQVPMYGIEGSPGTAAIATANFATSVRYHQRQHQTSKTTTTRHSPAISMLLPFSLAMPAQMLSIRAQGGVCFSKPQYIGGRYQKDNIGGRFIETTTTSSSGSSTSSTGALDCAVSSGAGATTLEFALRGLPKCSHLHWPRIYIAKIDVEGFEFKAFASVAASWLAEQPPCYIMFEHYNKPSYTALIELFLNVGYDAAWRTRNNEFPLNTPPWWTLAGQGDNFHTLVSQHTGRGYTEMIMGFADESACVNRM